jgi:hypothetical protein
MSETAILPNGKTSFVRHKANRILLGENGQRSSTVDEQHLGIFSGQST